MGVRVSSTEVDWKTLEELTPDEIRRSGMSANIAARSEDQIWLAIHGHDCLAHPDTCRQIAEAAREYWDQVVEANP